MREAEAANRVPRTYLAMCSSTCGSFEGRSAVTTWLLSIARFKALSARRRRSDAELDETIETTVADSADDPETARRRTAVMSFCVRR